MKKIGIRHLAVMSAAGLVAVTSAGCASDHHAQAVCVDRSSHERVRDSQCHAHSTDAYPYVWWYIAYGRTLPPVGSAPRSGSTTEPEEGAVRGGAPARGGTVSEEEEPQVHVNPPAEPEPVEPHFNVPVEPHVG